MVARWVFVGLFGLLAGILLVRYLVASPMVMSLYLLMLVVSLALLAWGILRLFHGQAAWLGLFLALVSFVAAYLVTNSLFLHQEEERELPAVQARGAGEGHTAVVYLTHGEPPAYSPMPWVETFKEIDSIGAPFIPVPFRPFFFQQLRNEYLKVGGSPHNFVHQAMLNSLENKLRMEGDQDTRFYIAFLDSNPRPDESAIRAVNEGASRVVVANVFLTVSSHTQAGQELVDAVGLEQYGVDVCMAPPLWDSPSLKRMFVERANRNLNGTDKSKVGILLVGHGQPESWDAIYPTQTEQELLFRQEVMDLLVQDGYSRENISLAWMEFKEPAIEEITQELGRRGVEKIFVFAASISAASIHSAYDIPEAVHRAGLPESVEVINLGAWDNDPLVIEAIREKLRDCGL